MIEVNNIIYIIIMVFTGALTGYITNDVALKMLFREYGIGKLKFGGVIVKTRKKLEKNLSLLVEKEIINHNTLKSQFHKKEMKEAVSNTVVSFFNEFIYKNTENVKIGDLPGFEITVDNISGFLKEYLEKNLTKTFIEMSKSIQVSDIVSSEQAYNLAVSITNQILIVIQDKHIVQQIIKDMYKNYHEVSLDELSGDNITNIIINNLNELLNDIFEEMRYKNDRDIHTLISKLYRDLDFDTFVETLEEYIGNKKISYFISDKSLEKLYDLFNEYLKNPNSSESIEVFCEGLLIALKKIEKPIIELFTGDLRNEIEKFLETQLPNIIERLIEIVQKNSHEIEELIESSIDQTIYDQQTIKRLILSAIRIFLIENFTQKYDIINKIVEMLRDIDIEDLSDTISLQVVELLHKQSISSIINELEVNNILTPKLIANQVHRILNFLCERYLSKDIEHSDILNKSIKDIFKLNLKPIVNNLTVTVITKQIIFNEDVLNFIKSQISQSLKSIARMPINTFIIESKISDYAEKLQAGINNQLNRNRDEILDIIYKHLDNFFTNHDLSSVINYKNEVVLKSDVIIDVIIKSLRNLIEDNKNYRVHDLFNQINSIDNLSENVVNAIINYLDNGLSNVLEGNIARVVENNIKNFSNEEILEMMQQFMGKQLKPLTILGAIMGGMVGLLLGVFQDQNVIFNWSNLPVLLSTMGIYALMGYLTNVVAIFFIFKPYEPIFGIKSLQGVIPRQIPVLAKAMGKVVSENLLSDDSINDMVVKNESRLKEAFITNIEKDDYGVIRTYLGENSERIVKQITIYIIKYIRENNAMLATKLTDEVMKFDINKLETHVFSTIFADIFIEKINKSGELISNYIALKFKSGKTIKELSEDLNINTVENKINHMVECEVLKFIDRFSNHRFLGEITLKNEGKINDIINNKLEDVIPETTKLSIENFLYTLVSTYLFSREKQRSLSNYVITEITTILNNNDSIDELFGGRFIELVNFNMTSILEKINETVVSWLISYRDEITDSVTKRVIEGLTVVQQVGYKAINGDKLIKETVYRIIENKLPDFISRKMDILSIEFNNFFDNFGKIRLKDAKLELRKEELHNFLGEVFDTKEIEIKTRRFIHVVMSYFYELNTKTIFDLLNIHETKDIVKKFEDIFVLINDGTYHTLYNRKDKIVFDITLLINKFITKEILSNKVRNLTLGIPEKEINFFVEKLIVTLNQNDFLKQNMNQLVDAMFKQLTKVPLNELLDELFLKQDMKKLIRKLAVDYHFEDVVNEAILSLFTLTTTELNTLIDKDLKSRMLIDIINATYDVVKENLMDLLKAVDFKEVTEREISAMEPKQIKQLFDSFGSKYFRKLEFYGIFGGIFAIEIVSVLFLIPYLIKPLRKK